MHRRLSGLLVVLTSVVAGFMTPGPAAAVDASIATGLYHAVTPHRVLDTRGHGAVAAHATRNATVTGTGVPGTATSVAITVTVTGATRGGYLTVFPAGGTLPNASNVNFAAGATVANLVVSAVGANGQVSIYNGSGGSSNVLVDVSGYYATAASRTGQGGYEALPSPQRAIDTRATHAIAARGSVTFAAAGVPAGASAAVVNLTATGASAAGYLTAFAADADQPGASNLNFARGATVANLAIVPLGADGRITVYNGSAGPTQLLVDVTGWLRQGDPVDTGAYASLAPARLVDTRSSHAVAAHGTLSLGTAGRSGVPAAHVAAVVLNVTAISGTRAGYLTTYAYGTARPTVSDVNFGPQQVVAGLVVAPVDAAGRVTVYNGSSGATDLVVDVAGYLTATTAPLPAVTSVGRYVRNISGASSDASTMQSEGCADARAGTTLSLLDIGAQSNTNPSPSANGVVLSADNPGVRLSALDPAVRLTYPQLEAALEGYLTGLGTADCSGPAHTTVAVDTNNDGDWSAYPAATKAADWAHVITVLQNYVATNHLSNVSVVGASDIEAGFASTAAQAESWVTDFLADSPVKAFVDTGSLDGCPTTWGAATNSSCGAGAAGTWTVADYVKLNRTLGGAGQISVLPQIYLPVQAVQWSVVDRAAGGLTFAGALTEHASCPAAATAGCTFAALPPSQGWAALYHAVSTVSSAPSIPAVTDLQSDDPSPAAMRASHVGVDRQRALGA